MGYTAFEVWLMELGVLTIHGRPLHPQTQGKDERYNRSFTRECLNVNSFLDIADAQLKFDAYRSFYNNIRPHCALDLNVPSAVFQKSEHPFPEKVIDWEYGPEYQRCKVSETGYFSYGGHRYFLSEGFRGKSIAVRESALPGKSHWCSDSSESAASTWTSEFTHSKSAISWTMTPGWIRLNV